MPVRNRKNVNKRKNELILYIRISSPYCGDHTPPWGIEQSHSPLKLKLLEVDGGRGGSWCPCFLGVLLVACCWLCCARSDVG